jgi:thiamine biosynthesis lipoprotein
MSGRHVEPCMGTVFSFDLRDPDIPPAALGEAVAWLHWVDATFSLYRAGSDISRLGRGDIRVAACAPEVQEILDLCERLREATGGYFSAYASGVLDPSGVVKGWAVERAAGMLRAAGSRNHSVNGGGDLQLAGGPEPGRRWRVGIADPLRPGTVATVIAGRDMAVATSGTGERGAHIIDPRTGLPAGGLASITVVGPRLTMVDAYATAAFAMGDAARDWIEALPGHEAYAVTADGRTWATSGLRPDAPAQSPTMSTSVAGHRAGAAAGRATRTAASRASSATQAAKTTPAVRSPSICAHAPIPTTGTEIPT